MSHASSTMEPSVVEMPFLTTATSWGALALASSPSIGNSTLMSMLEQELGESFGSSASWNSFNATLFKHIEPSASLDSLMQLVSDSVHDLADMSAALTESTSLTKEELQRILSPLVPEPMPPFAKPLPIHAWDQTEHVAHRRPFSILAEMGLELPAEARAQEVTPPVNVAALPECLVPGRSARNNACTVDDLPSFDSLQVLSRMRPALVAAPRKSRPVISALMQAMGLPSASSKPKRAGEENEDAYAACI
ncbi:hypothetical protein AURDEDRAFT_186964 [Auricularia subglabra TFB-10046 SS5]|nr:hypothetical protein AURDEDRAFT_186964 [Auricularia subglabra TFB-10046 SS5]